MPNVPAAHIFGYAAASLALGLLALISALSWLRMHAIDEETKSIELTETFWCECQAWPPYIQSIFGREDVEFHLAWIVSIFGLMLVVVHAVMLLSKTPATITRLHSWLRTCSRRANRSASQISEKTEIELLVAKSRNTLIRDASKLLCVVTMPLVTWTAYLNIGELSWSQTVTPEECISGGSPFRSMPSCTAAIARSVLIHGSILSLSILYVTGMFLAVYPMKPESRLGDLANVSMSMVWAFSYSSKAYEWFVDVSGWTLCARILQGVMFGNPKLSTVLNVLLTFIDVGAFIKLNKSGANAYASTVIALFVFASGVFWRFESLLYGQAQLSLQLCRTNDGLKQTLHRLCDFVLHLDDSLTLVESCPQLDMALASPGRFCAGANLQLAFSSLTEFQKLRGKCSDGGTEAHMAEMVDTNGTAVSVQLNITTLENEHGQLEIIIGGSELVERGHPEVAPLAQLPLAMPGTHKLDTLSSGDLQSAVGTEEMFRQLGRAGVTNAAVNQVLALGESEHWLISADEIQIFSQHILGSGSFGFVVGGSFRRTNVVIKLTRGDGNLTMQHRIALCNEIRVLRQITHPNIVLFYGACFDGRRGDFSLVLEHIDGHSMLQHVARHDLLASKDRAGLCKGIGRALCCLHSHKPVIVHGDLKPHNVMIVQAGDALVPKLIDFGLSRALGKHPTRLGGTPLWMAPEVFNGELGTAKADIFSFGRIVFFLETRRVPLAGWSRERIATVASKMEVPELSWPGEDECDDMHGLAKDLSLRCCTSSPEGRPTACEVLELMRSWVVSAEKALEAMPYEQGLTAARSKMMSAGSSSSFSQVADSEDSYGTFGSFQLQCMRNFENRVEARRE